MTTPDTYHAISRGPADSDQQTTHMHRAIAATDATQAAITDGHTAFTVTIEEHPHPADPNTRQYQATVKANA